MKELVNISDAAKTLSLSIDTIRRWDKKGLIKAHRDDKNYRVFDINELLRAQRKYVGGDCTSNKYSVLKSSKVSTFSSVELFAGAGGLALGLENAGFQHNLLVEIDKYAAATLKVNRPQWNVICADAREVSYENLSADVVTGGFPCQSFSYAGNQMGFEDARGTLFFELARSNQKTKT